MPTNTRVWVAYSVIETQRHLVEDSPSWGDVRIRDRQTGEDVDVQRIVDAEAYRVVFTLVPRVSLHPETEYEILDRVPQQVCPWNGRMPSACFGPPGVIARFRTGATPDTSAPAFGGVHRRFSEPVEECSHSACCGPYRGFRFTLEGDDAIDDGEIAGYNVYDQGRRIATALPRPSWSTMFFCSGGYHYLESANSSRGPYEMRAMDLAGNEEKNGVTITLDAGRCNGGGCAMGRSAPGAGVAAGIALLIVLVCHRARRRRRPGV